MRAIRQAAILIGGRGTRLGPLTASTPKPLLPCGDRPFLAWQLRELCRYGVDEVLLLAGHQAGDVVAALPALAAGLPRPMRLECVTEPSPAGTGGALFHAGPRLAERFLLLNGDSWLDTPCEIISGDDSEVGAVRSLMGGSYVEVLTSQTRYSYAYAALDMKDSLQKFIHGAVEVRPTSKNRSKILYTLIYDDTQVADQADRNIDLERRSAFIRKGLRKMKEIAERR